MGNISGQAKNDQIHLFLENINIPWALIRFLDLQSWTKKMENFSPLPPKSRMGKWHGLAFARFHP